MAIAGLGSAATRAHLPSLQRLRSDLPVTLVAAADTNGERRREARALMRGTPIFDDAATMLTSVASDVLIIATEPTTHAGLIVLGAACNQVVVCEKPLVLDGPQQARVTEAYRARPGRVLISVHQYRFSPPWPNVSRWLRGLHGLGLPVTMAVEVRRPATDPHANSSWRTNVRAFGGMLADHGVHYLALAHTIHPEVELTRAERTLESDGVERSCAEARFGRATLTLFTATGAPSRSTLIRVSAAGATLTWWDGEAQLVLGRHPVQRWRVPTLSDRTHIDALYTPFYREMFENLTDRDWRRKRTAEALTVGRAVVAMLDQANTTAR